MDTKMHPHFVQVQLRNVQQRSMGMENSITGKSLANIPREMCQSLPTYSEQHFGTCCSNRKGMCRNVHPMFDLCLLIGVSEACCTLRKNFQKQRSHSVLFGCNNNITIRLIPQKVWPGFHSQQNMLPTWFSHVASPGNCPMCEYFLGGPDYPPATLGSFAIVQSHNGGHPRKIVLWGKLYQTISWWLRAKGCVCDE